MKYKLETIPVWDALKEDSECPLCHLELKIQDYYLNYYLGSSVMNPETRMKVNQTGFCPDHFKGLLAKKKAHGLGLMTHTHMEESRKKLIPLLKDMEKQGTKGSKGKKSLQKANEKLLAWIHEKENSCLICQGVEKTMKRYAFTLAYLWKDDGEFRQAWQNSRGICLHHMPLQINLAQEALNAQEQGEFCQVLAELQQKALQRLDDEILWFTQKFDSQNNDKDWGTSKDAHRRSIQKLIGPLE